MTESISKQMLLQRSIERALDNFKKVGKANLTAAKIRNRIANLKETWTQYQNGHAMLMGSLPAKDRASLDYFKERYFEVTEEAYQSTGDYMMDCLEELEPIRREPKPVV